MPDGTLRPTAGADQARDAMRKVIDAVYGPAHTAGGAYVKAYLSATAATDLVEAMQHTVLLVTAAEHLKDMATEAEKSIRSILAETMNDTGCTQIDAGSIKAHLSRKPTFVSIDQEEMLPAEFMHQPPPSPDKKKIKSAIEAGDDVPGCTLARPNEMQLNIRAKKE